MKGDDTADREANAATVRAYAQAWQDGELATLGGFYHDEFVLHYFGQSQLAGDHVGKQAAMAALGKVQGLTNRKLITVQDVLAGPGHGAIMAHEKWKRDGKTLEVHRVFVYHLRDGKLSECWLYDDDQRAVDDFWTE